MQLFFDANDLIHARKLRDDRYKWLREMGAIELSQVPLSEQGFLFAYQHGDQHYRDLVRNHPNIFDRPEHREELVCLDDVLKRLDQRAVHVPTPKTWIIAVDDTPPDDLQFPLFVRTPKSSWKRGGTQSRVRNLKELNDETELLRKTFGWDTPILARQWIDVAVAGKFMFGDAPQEIRVWIVDHRPIAWSFHYLHVVQSPKGFPPSNDDLSQLAQWARAIGSAFQSRLIVADFIRDRRGAWWFLEAGPGSAAGTAHEAAFRFVAKSIRGDDDLILKDDTVGGAL